MSAHNQMFHRVEPLHVTLAIWSENSKKERKNISFFNRHCLFAQKKNWLEPWITINKAFPVIRAICRNCSFSNIKKTDYTQQTKRRERNMIGPGTRTPVTKSNTAWLQRTQTITEMWCVQHTAHCISQTQAIDNILQFVHIRQRRYTCNQWKKKNLNITRWNSKYWL